MTAAVKADRKYYNFETMYQKVAEKLQRHLNNCGYKYEISGCFDSIHFEILLSADEARKLNSYISAI